MARAPLTFTDENPPAPADPVLPATRSARAQAKADMPGDLVEDAGAPHGGGCDGQAGARPGGCLGHGPAADPGGLARWPGYGRSGWDVGGERGQVGVGPRRQRLAHPQVEFVLGQHALHERGLERADHVLAVGV
jgi:hypothetical protein